jgi:CheY-like chemotaxis protein
MQESRFDGARVLLIEDDPDTRELVAEFLEALGASVATAGTGSSGFEKFKNERPALILSDLWMPNGDGFDLIRRIRSLSPDEGGLTPAVAMSAAENVKSAIAAGFHAFLAKPFDFETLVTTIDDFVGPSGTPQTIAPWTISPQRDAITLTFAGVMQAADAALMSKALMVHLERGPVDIVADMRRLQKFGPSVASVVERAIWPVRHKIRRVRLLGGPMMATLVAVATCKVLGIPFVLVESADAHV